MINIFVIDDHPMIIEGVKAIFDGKKEKIKVVDFAYSAKEALGKLKKTTAHVILLDLLMPEFSGVELCQILKKEYPDKKVIAFTGETDTAILFNAWMNKADAILMKYCGRDELVNTIHAVLAGERKVGSNVPNFFIQIESTKNGNTPRLTRRELQVLNALAKGHKRSEVGELLNISKVAVDFHCKNLFKKFNKTRLLEVITEARNANIIY